MHEQGVEIFNTTKKEERRSILWPFCNAPEEIREKLWKCGTESDSMIRNIIEFSIKNKEDIQEKLVAFVKAVEICWVCEVSSA